MPKAHRDMFHYCNAVMEPWDGPAAIAATDGRWVIAGLDRNGLRPLRYTITSDDLLIVGSETGMVQVDRGRRSSRRAASARARCIGVDLDTAKFYRDDAMKDLLAARQPFGDWAKRITRHRPHRQDRRASSRCVYDAEDAAPPPGCRRLHAGGAGADPASDGGGRAGSRRLAWATTRRSPCCPSVIAACTTFSARPSARSPTRRSTACAKRRVMSLKTRLGNLGNVLDEDASQCDLLQLESPVLSTAEFAAMREFMGDVGLRGRLHLPGRRRRGRTARRVRTYPPRSRGRRARRLHACHPDRRRVRRRTARRSR